MKLLNNQIIKNELININLVFMIYYIHIHLYIQRYYCCHVSFLLVTNNSIKSLYWRKIGIKYFYISVSEQRNVHCYLL